MTEKIRIIKGPTVPEQISRPWESNIFRPVYSVYLDSGIIVTNPDQFPPEEAGEKEFLDVSSGQQKE